MDKVKFLNPIIIIAILCLLFQSCATIIGGKRNTLVFSEESLPKAEIFIDGDLVGEAPGKIKVPKHKIQHGSILLVKAQGYDEKEYLIMRKQSKPYSIIDLLLFGVPLAVDYTTGNIYRPVPRKFEYKLVKQQ
jgi:hypothetical protein